MVSRAKAGFLLAPSVFVAVWIAPLPLATEAHRLAAIAACVVVLWITEAIPIPVTALLGSVLCILLGVASAPVVLAPYADPIIFLFLGAFVLGEAIVSSGLDRRVAAGLLGVRALSSTGTRLVGTLAMITALISMWMSNTAAAAIMTPLALSMLRRRGDSSPQASGGDTVVFTVACAASLGGIATPVGTPPNLIAIGFLQREHGVHVDFLSWMSFGLPLAIVLTLGLIVLSRFTLRHVQPPCPPSEGESPRRWSGSQKAVGFVFALMVAGWLLPSLFALLAPGDAAKLLTERMPESLVALSGAILLFILPARTRPYAPVLSWRQTAGIDWGTILLFGGGLSLGGLVISTGLGARVGAALLGATGVETRAGLIVLAVGSGIVLTELMSNTAAANVIVPVIYAMALQMSVDPFAPVIAATLGANMGYMLPISTPPNAIAYGTGLISVPQMARRGVLLDAIAFICISCWVIFLL